jgi:hypothetical protein
VPRVRAGAAAGEPAGAWLERSGIGSRESSMSIDAILPYGLDAKVKRHRRERSGFLGGHEGRRLGDSISGKAIATPFEAVVSWIEKVDEID